MLSEPVYTSLFDLMAKIASKTPAELTREFLPGLVSLATHILSSEYKHVHASHKVQVIEILETILTKYFYVCEADFDLLEEQGGAEDTEAGEKKQQTPAIQDLKSMVSMVLKLKKTKAEEEEKSKKAVDSKVVAPGTLARLESCFAYIRKNLYKCQEHPKVIDAFN